MALSDVMFTDIMTDNTQAVKKGVCKVQIQCDIVVIDVSYWQTSQLLVQICYRFYRL